MHPPKNKVSHNNRSLRSVLHSFNLPSFSCLGNLRQMRAQRLSCIKNDARKWSSQEEEIIELESEKEEIVELEFKEGEGVERESEQGEIVEREIEVKSAKGRSKEKDSKTDDHEDESENIWKFKTTNSSATFGRKSARIEYFLEKQRKPVSISLTKNEVEEDFIGMCGHSPSRRPIKRPRSLQRRLDTLFPGSQLSVVCQEKY